MKQLKMTPALGTTTTMLVRTPGRKKSTCQTVKPFSLDSTISLRSSTRPDCTVETPDGMGHQTPFHAEQLFQRLLSRRAITTILV